MNKSSARNWGIFQLSDLCRPRQWTTIPSTALTDEGYPVFGANGLIGYYKEYNHDSPTIAITCRGATCGEVNVTPEKCYITGNAMALDDVNETICNQAFLYQLLSFRGFDDIISGSAQPQIIASDIGRVEIALPPLPEQRRIAAILGIWDAAIEKAERLATLAEEQHARLSAALIDRYGVDRAPLSDIAHVTTGQLAPQFPKAFAASGHPFLRVSDLEPLLDQGEPSDPEYLDEGYARENRYRLFPPGTIIFAKSGMSARLARVYAIRQASYLVSHLCAVIPHSPVIGRYIFHWLSANPPTSLIQGDGFPSIRTSAVASLEVNLPAEDMVETIADALDLSLVSITVAKAIASALRRQKSGLMQKLLTGKIRVPDTTADLSPAAD